jgi:hypothetical protein
MEVEKAHYIENGIHFYHGEPDVRSLVLHHHLTDEEAEDIAKHVARLKRNARRRLRYAAKKNNSVIFKPALSSNQQPFLNVPIAT